MEEGESNNGEKGREMKMLVFFKFDVEIQKMKGRLITKKNQVFQ